MNLMNPIMNIALWAAFIFFISNPRRAVREAIATYNTPNPKIINGKLTFSKLKMPKSKLSEKNRE